MHFVFGDSSYDVLEQSKSVNKHTNWDEDALTPHCAMEKIFFNKCLRHLINIHDINEEVGETDL